MALYVDVFIHFLSNQALGGGVVALYVDKNDDLAPGVNLQRRANQAVEAQRTACEAAANRLLPDLPGGVGYDKNAQKEAALLVPWRAPKLYATKAAHAGASPRESDLWWGNPFWYPKKGWAKLCIE